LWSAARMPGMSQPGWSAARSAARGRAWSSVIGGIILRSPPRALRKRRRMMQVTQIDSGVVWSLPVPSLPFPLRTRLLVHKRSPHRALGRALHRSLERSRFDLPETHEAVADELGTVRQVPLV